MRTRKPLIRKIVTMAVAGTAAVGMSVVGFGVVAADAANGVQPVTFSVSSGSLTIAQAPSAAIALVAAFTKAPASRFDSWMFTKDDEFRDPRGIPKLADFQRAIDVEHEFGLIQKTIDANHYADLSLVKEAAARLK